jgi:hypothetical protein
MARPNNVATATIDCLAQLTFGPVWDGNLISKSERDRFKQAGWVDQRAGFNFLTATGVSICATLNLLRSDQPGQFTDGAYEEHMNSVLRHIHMPDVQS